MWLSKLHTLTICTHNNDGDIVVVVVGRTLLRNGICVNSPNTHNLAQRFLPTKCTMYFTINMYALTKCHQFPSWRIYWSVHNAWLLSPFPSWYIVWNVIQLVAKFVNVVNVIVSWETFLCFVHAQLTYKCNTRRNTNNQCGRDVLITFQY